ncbi:T9SS type A sorting domain-containing protein [bacterium AH-315-C20]|nr:T9SS type A sorting domain-containing protein [bacterium AH-315-C20]
MKSPKNLLILSILLLLTSTSIAQWAEVQKVVAADRFDTDWYGYASAISGDYAIVGAYLEDEDASGASTIGQAGSVYIYERDADGVWNEVQKIVASDRGLNDEFGYAVSLSGDYAVIGARWEDQDASGGSTMFNSGSAYVFERNSGGTWVEVQKIVTSDRAISDEFGSTVSISGDYLIIGAEDEDEDVSGSGTLTSAGSAYIFERDGGGVWNEVQKIVASDREFQDKFGHAVGISGDYAIIGAEEEDHDAAGGAALSEAGSAYIFERNSGGIWIEVQKIVAGDREANDEFGKSIAISGTYAIIGAAFEDHDETGGAFMSNAGSAYVFERDGAGVWNEAQKIVASDRATQDDFGWSVAIDGDQLVVGANLEDENESGGATMTDAGSAYVFKRTAGSWTEVSKIVSSDRDVDDLFANSVGISGNYVIAGTRWEDHDVGGGAFMDRAGSAYFFEGASCESSNSISPSACNSYLSPSGNYTYTTTGIYQDTLMNSAGCDSLITINLTINTIDTSVTESSGTLSAVLSGVTYQWLDCSGMTLIVGETNQDFTPTTTGSYAVIVDDGTCVDTSNCHGVIVLGIEEFGKINFQLYPNPGLGTIYILIDSDAQNTSVEISSLSGQLVRRIDAGNKHLIEIQLEEAAGIYVIRLAADNFKPAVVKYIKE